MQQNTLIPSELVDRQMTAARRGVDGVSTIADGQRAVTAAALQLPMLWLEALTQVSRTLLATTLELVDRMATTSSESIDRYTESLIAVAEGTERAPSPTRKASAAAA